MLEFFKEYLPYLKNYKGKLALAIFGMLLVSASTAAVAYLVKPVMDKIFIEQDIEMLYVLPVFIVLAFLGKGVGAFLSSYYLTYIGEDVVRIMKNKMLRHIVALDLDFHLNKHSGELISRITNDISKIQNAIASDAVNFFKSLFTVLGLLVVVIYQSPKLALFSIIVIPAAVLPISIISKKIKKLSKKSQEQNSRLTSSLSEIFNNYEMVKAYNAQEYELERFEKENLNYFKINMKNVKNQQLLAPIFEVVGAISIVAVIVVGGREVLVTHELTTGGFFSFLTALSLLLDPLKRLSNSYSKFQIAVAANERIKEIMSHPIMIESGKEKVEKIDNIEVKNLSLSYGDKKAVKNINFSAKKGDMVGLVGDSGGGKSSVVNLLLRFYDPSEGSILINGKDMRNFDINELREHICVVSQRIYIVNDTVAANVAYGKEKDIKKIKEVLKKANILDYIESLPDGIDTVLDESGTNLSGGQRQRIAIARALYRDPDILILDEATSALDNKSEASIMKTIEELKEKLLVFIVAHRLSTVENSDKILVFEHGKIVCQGDIDTLKKDCDSFKKLYSLT
ncbi:MAG: ABC transporter ATP-binding protein [Epsilonproteobacteria bacterium]|nr:ABC transporter ATP-binding protein [Campylobacterota bacterium]